MLPAFPPSPRGRSLDSREAAREGLLDRQAPASPVLTVSTGGFGAPKKPGPRPQLFYRHCVTSDKSLRLAVPGVVLSNPRGGIWPENGV